MSWEICFDFNGRRVCIPIPILVEKFRPRPDPERFIIDDLLKEEVVHDISVLTTIDTLAAQLQTLRVEPLQAALREAISQLDIPKDLELHQQDLRA
jgi:hypothetical protein